VPGAMVAVAGVIAMEERTEPVTVSLVVPVRPPSVAVMFVVPVPLLATNPVGETVATGVDEDDQVTRLVKSCGVPLLVAVSCSIVPNGIEGLAGETVIVLAVPVTVRVVCALRGDPRPVKVAPMVAGFDVGPVVTAAISRYRFR